VPRLLTPLIILLLTSGCASVTLPRVEGAQVTLQLQGRQARAATVTVVDGDNRIDYTPDANGRVTVQLPGRPRRSYALLLGMVPVSTSPHVMIEVWAGGERLRRLSQGQVLDLPRNDAGRRVLGLP
jgi:ABC-type Fe3+-hydroxamate transport system substrate-binding protein